MATIELEQEWDLWLTQARNFAERENYLDAVARTQQLCGSIEVSLQGQTNVKLRGRVEQFLALSQRQLAEYLAQYEQWNNAIAERRQADIDGAAEEMARPMPNPPPSNDA